MIRHLRFFLTVLFLAMPLLAQVPAPSPKPTSPPRLPGDENDVVKISTTLIQVDAVVTDKNGKVVTGLKPEDFEIFENGKKQQLTNFSFVSTVESTKTSAAVTAKDPNAPYLPPTKLKAEQVRRTIALVVDDLGLSFQSIYYVRRSLKKFIDEQMQPDDLVAIIRTGSGVGALQQFTSDKRQLYAAIEKIKWNSLGRASIGAFDVIEATPLEQAKSSGADISEEQIAAERRMNAEREESRTSVFTVGTLGAVNFIVNGMAELPGRKSIMLFSDGFQICANREDLSSCNRFVGLLKNLTDRANRAAVTIYSMDARGLQPLGLTAADNLSGLSNDAITQRINDRRDEFIGKQEGLAFLANQTGGRSFINNNDMNWALDKALEDQKGYYLLGYEPDDESFDPKVRRFNKLEVKVKIPGLQVRYRSGFFGVEDSKTKSVANLTPAQHLQKALISPFSSSGINIKLNTLFGSDEKSGGSFVNSFLHINASDLMFEEGADGMKKAVFDIIAVSFDENGAPVDQIGKSYTLSGKGEFLDKLKKKGFVYQFMFPVKKPGPYQMRVAILDRVSEKVGSANLFIEVPNLKKDRLELSGVVLESFTAEQWTQLNKGERIQTDPMSDTSLRRFRRNTNIRFLTEIYNVRIGPSGSADLEGQIKIYHNSKLIFESAKAPIKSESNPAVKSKLLRAAYEGGFALGPQMAPGEYLLQVTITDKLAKQKYGTVNQWVNFEIEE